MPFQPQLSQLFQPVQPSQPHQPTSFEPQHMSCEPQASHFFQPLQFNQPPYQETFQQVFQRSSQPLQPLTTSEVNSRRNRVFINFPRVRRGRLAKLKTDWVINYFTLHTFNFY